MRKALAVGRKEFWQIVRDRRTLMILLFVPAFFLLLYGYALNWDIRHVRLAVLDREHTAESRELLSSFVNSTYFDIVADPGVDGRDRGPDGPRGDPGGAGDSRGHDARPPIGPRGHRAGHHQRRQRQHGDRHLRLRPGHRAGVSAQLQVQLAGGAAGAPPLSVQPRIWYNPELQSTLFLVPGLIAFIVMISCRRLDVAVDRAREGARHLGAGADGAHLDAVPTSSARRSRTSSSRWRPRS